MATKDDILRAAHAPVTQTESREATPDATIGTATLPPPGHGRDEVLRMRQDELQHLIEEQADRINLGMLNPDAITPDTAILRHVDDIYAVTNPQPYRQYCWVECGLRDDHPEHVHHKQMEGWQFITADDPECPDIPRSPQGHRRLGTAVLMWVPLEKWITLQAKIHAANLRQRGDLNNADTLLSIAERHGANVRVIKNWQDLSPELRSRAEQRFLDRKRTLERAAATIDRELRQGTAHLNYGHQRHATL